MKKEWQEWIVSDPSIRAGKLIFKGTRISVEFVLERLANGWTHDMILENYPSLTLMHLSNLEVRQRRLI
jgi:uncharacterized protein (DUF433 family)